MNFVSDFEITKICLWFEQLFQVAVNEKTINTLDSAESSQFDIGGECTSKATWLIDLRIQFKQASTLAVCTVKRKDGKDAFVTYEVGERHAWADCVSSVGMNVLKTILDRESKRRVVTESLFLTN